MKLGVALVLLVIAVVAVAIVAQHARYLRARREKVQDLQAIFHSGDAFHVVTYLQAAPGSDPIEEVRKLREDLEASGEAQMVYAGRVAFTALPSAQVPDHDWSAIVLVQYPSRAVYDARATSDAQRSALGRFAAHYSHGLERSPGLNAALPVFLLGKRVVDVVTRAPSPLPFEPVAPGERYRPGGVDVEERLARLDDLKELSEDALVVVNLLQHGTKEQRDADAAYGLRMMGMFAQGGFGPMHMGRARTLEGDARFDRVAIVYYPGVDFFQEMTNSTFFNGIVGDKQPSDTLAIPTVPFLARL